MNRAATDASIYIKERFRDEKTLHSIGSSHGILIESRKQIDGVEPNPKKSVHGGEPVIFQVPHNHRPRKRDRESKISTDPKSTSMPRLRLRRPAIYFRCSTDHRSRSGWDDLDGVKIAQNDNASPRLASASLGIRSLPREIKLQQTEGRAENQQKNPSHGYVDQTTLVQKTPTK